MVLVANTVADPRAVMVHSHDTSIANTAMVRPWWSKTCTPKTITPQKQILAV